ncbi:ABC transporter permease, partial [Yersinia enterocolitica]|nr:ABC transporter permease [Yersinia enterocolitica]
MSIQITKICHTLKRSPSTSIGLFILSSLV